MKSKANKSKKRKQKQLDLETKNENHSKEKSHHNPFSLLLNSDTPIDKSSTSSSSHPSNKKQNISPSLANKIPTLIWNSPNQIYTPLETELSFIPILIRSKNEHGMYCTKPKQRIKTLQTQCESNSISILQALSLRRHHMKLLRSRQTHDLLGLGNESNIRKAAALFESCLSNFVSQQKINFMTEKAQRKRFRKVHGDQTKLVGTPDFLFESPILFKATMGLSCLSVLSPHHKNIERAKPSSYQPNPNHNNIELHITITMKIKWMEAKMFYGASSIPNDGSSAVGKLLSTAEKYVDLYGNGVMIFAYGCGQELASKLYRKGVLAMDASPCDLTLLKEQQRTWCADQDGTILI